MIAWSLAAFGACESVAAVVVAIPPEAERGSSSHHPDIRQVVPDDGSTICVAGGATRAESVSNALARVETDLVAVHDAARPLITPELVEGVVAALEAEPGAAAAIAAAAIADTVKRSTSMKGTAAVPFMEVVEATLDRSELWAAQTPQVFRTEALRAALPVDEAMRDAATDEAMLIEAAGGIVLLHEVSGPNLKVTTRDDLRVAELLLQERLA